MADPHAISELYQHIITAVVVLVPMMGAFAAFAWRVSWRLGRIDYKIGLMWRAFCKQHKLNGGDADLEERAP